MPKKREPASERRLDLTFFGGPLDGGVLTNVPYDIDKIVLIRASDGRRIRYEVDQESLHTDARVMRAVVTRNDKEYDAELEQTG